MGGIPGEEKGCRKHKWGGRNCSAPRAEPERAGQGGVDGPAGLPGQCSLEPQAKGRGFGEGAYYWGPVKENLEHTLADRGRSRAKPKGRVGSQST